MPMFGSKTSAVCRQMPPVCVPLIRFMRECNTEYTHFKTQRKNCQAQGTRTDTTVIPSTPDGQSQLVTSKVVSVEINTHQKNATST